MSVPSARTSSGRIAFTAAWVPTGMNAGVRTTPCAVLISPRRALPSVLCSRNEKPGMANSAVIAFRGMLGHEYLTQVQFYKYRTVIVIHHKSRAAEQQAGIAVGIEPVAGVDRMRVSVLHGLEAGESRDQHEQGRARQVEIRHQRVGGAELVSRGDEQRSLAAERQQDATLAAGAFDLLQRRWAC